MIATIRHTAAKHSGSRVRAWLPAALALTLLPYTAAAAAADMAGDRFFKPEAQLKLAEHVGLIGGARNACSHGASDAAFRKFLTKYILLLNIKATPEVLAAVNKGAATGVNSVTAGTLPCADVEKSAASFDGEIAQQWPELEKYQLTRLSWTAGFADACGVPKERLTAFIQKVFAVTRLPMDANVPLVKEQIAAGQKAKLEQPSACSEMIPLIEAIEKNW